MRWTHLEIELAIKLFKEGKEYSEIAKKIQRTTRAVRCKLNKNGIKKYKQKKELKKCLHCGKNIGMLIKKQETHKWWCICLPSRIESVRFRLPAQKSTKKVWWIKK